MKRLSLNIPEELHQRFRVACTLQGRAMSEVMRTLIHGYVENAGRRKLIVVQKKNSA